VPFQEGEVVKKALGKLRNLLRIDPLTNFVNQRTVREKFLILGFSGLLLASGDYFLWVSPVVGVLTRTLPTDAAAKLELQNMKEDQKNETQIRDRLTRVKAELEERERGMSAASQTDDLLEGLSTLAMQSGVRITSVNPSEGGPASRKYVYSPFPIDVKAMASTHELGAFLSSLETGDIPFKVLNLRINQDPQSPKKHLIELKVETYRRKVS
jgi:Tfp pilus assembly protein PilO